MTLPMHTLTRRILASFVVALTLAPTVAMAAPLLVPIVPDSCNGVGGCQSICDFAKLAQNVLNDGIIIAVIVAAFTFAYAGFRLVVARGNPAGLTAAKKLLLNVLIGTFLIVGAWLIVDTLISALVGHTGLQWNRICSN